MRKIVIEKGYLFPDAIMTSLNSIINKLNEVYNIQQREYSIENREIPDEAIIILKDLNGEFDLVVTNIRKDLHIDDDFIHEFIKKYKALNS